MKPAATAAAGLLLVSTAPLTLVLTIGVSGEAKADYSQVQAIQKRAYNLRSKKQRLIEEHKIKVVELRAGLYCSECRRSKSEIEKGGQPFGKHLKDVKGHAIPMSEEEIREITKRLERELAEIDRELASLEQEARQAVYDEQKREFENWQRQQQANRDKLKAENDRRQQDFKDRQEAMREQAEQRQEQMQRDQEALRSTLDDVMQKVQEGAARARQQIAEIRDYYNNERQRLSDQSRQLDNDILKGWARVDAQSKASSSPGSGKIAQAQQKADDESFIAKVSNVFADSYNSLSTLVRDNYSEIKEYAVDKITDALPILGLVQGDSTLSMSESLKNIGGKVMDVINPLSETSLMDELRNFDGNFFADGKSLSQRLEKTAETLTEWAGIKSGKELYEYSKEAIKGEIKSQVIEKATQWYDDLTWKYAPEAKMTSEYISGILDARAGNFKGGVERAANGLTRGFDEMVAKPMNKFMDEMGSQGSSRAPSSLSSSYSPSGGSMRQSGGGTFIPYRPQVDPVPDTAATTQPPASTQAMIPYRSGPSRSGTAPPAAASSTTGGYSTTNYHVYQDVYEEFNDHASPQPGASQPTSKGTVSTQQAVQVIHQYRETQGQITNLIKEEESLKAALEEPGVTRSRRTELQKSLKSTTDQRVKLEAYGKARRAEVRLAGQHLALAGMDQERSRCSRVLTQVRYKVSMVEQEIELTNRRLLVLGNSRLRMTWELRLTEKMRELATLQTEEMQCLNAMKDMGVSVSDP
ncbi:DUF4175 domain-containing protein [Brevifollis gellanilyticus]|nr:DUF4175 domain-containing protein [Brevifollis gellanilyticus]